MAGGTSAPSNSAMQLTTPGGDGASQLIARLAGSARRLVGDWRWLRRASARPNGPAPLRAPSLRPQRGHGRERARAGARRRAVASHRLRIGLSRGLPGAHGARRAPARWWPLPLIDGRRPAGLGAAWRWRPPCWPRCRAARRVTAPVRRGSVRPAPARRGPEARGQKPSSVIRLRTR